MSGIVTCINTEERNILASQFSACINMDKYGLAGDLLFEKKLPKKFVIDKCFIPVLEKDFQKVPMAKRFFIWLSNACGNTIMPHLLVTALRNKEAFSYLLDHSEEILKNTEVIQKCFRKIVKKGYVFQCRALIKKLSEKNISIQSIIGSSKDEQLPIFLEPIKQKTWDIFQEFIAAVPSLDPCFSDGNTLLHEITAAGYIVPLYKVFVFIKELAHETINMENNKKRTPLMNAIETGNSDIVEFLIANGADFTEKRGEITPLEFAQTVADNRIIVIIRNALFGDFEISRDITKDSPLGQKMIRKKEEGMKLCVAEFLQGDNISVNIVAITKLLQEGWVNPNLVCDEKGNTLACFAAAYDLIDIVELLAKGEADFTIANSDRKTPFMLAAKYGCVKVLEFFARNFPYEFISKNHLNSKNAIDYMIETMKFLQKEAKEQYDIGYKEGLASNFKKKS